MHAEVDSSAPVVDGAVDTHREPTAPADRFPEEWPLQTRLGDFFPLLRELSGQLGSEFNPYSRKSDPKIPKSWDPNPTHTREPYNGFGEHDIWLHMPPTAIPRDLWEARHTPPLAETMRRRHRYVPETERAFAELVEANGAKLRRTVQDFAFYQSSDSDSGAEGEAGGETWGEEDTGEEASEVAGGRRSAARCSSGNGEGGESAEESSSEEEVTRVNGGSTVWSVPPLFWRDSVSLWNKSNIWRDPRLTFELKDSEWRARRAQYVVATHPAINGYEDAMPLAGRMVGRALAEVADTPAPFAAFVLVALLQALWHETRKVCTVSIRRALPAAEISSEALYDFFIATRIAINGHVAAMPFAGCMPGRALAEVADAPALFADFVLAGLLQVLWHETRKVRSVSTNFIAANTPSCVRYSVDWGLRRWCWRF
jgi:hypothetical protein